MQRGTAKGTSTLILVVTVYTTNSIILLKYYEHYLRQTEQITKEEKGITITVLVLTESL